jgi:cytosine permease
VAGALGKSPTPAGLEPALAAQQRLEQLYRSSKPDDLEVIAARAEVRSISGANFTVREVIARGIGGLGGSVMLLVLGLAMLGPSCYAPFIFGHRFAAVAPRLKRWAWSLIGGIVAWPLVALGLPGRPELMYSLLGAVMAPVVGAMAADYVLSRGVWPGPRRGVNLAGCLAWVAGFVVGVVPPLAAEMGLRGLAGIQPAAVLAFVAAFSGYVVLARLGFEPPALGLASSAPMDGMEPAPGPVAEGEA